MVEDIHGGKGVERAAGCVICGDTATVKSHLIPRAIFHDMTRHGPERGRSRKQRLAEPIAVHERGRH